MSIHDNDDAEFEPRDGPNAGYVNKECPLCGDDVLDKLATHLPECPER